MNRRSLVVPLAAILLLGCTSTQYHDVGKWDQEGVCGAVEEALIDANYRIETREIQTPPAEQEFRARFVGVHHETLGDTRCSVHVRQEEKVGRYRIDVRVDEENPWLLRIQQRSESKEGKFLDELGEGLAKVTMRNQTKP